VAPHQYYGNGALGLVLVHCLTFAVFQMDIPDIGDYQNSEIKGSSMHIVFSIHTRTRAWGPYKMSLATYQHDIYSRFNHNNWS
jgi:hypothetical protein